MADVPAGHGVERGACAVLSARVVRGNACRAGWVRQKMVDCWCGTQRRNGRKTQYRAGNLACWMSFRWDEPRDRYAGRGQIKIVAGAGSHGVETFSRGSGCTCVGAEMGNVRAQIEICYGGPARAGEANRVGIRPEDVYGWKLGAD